MSAAQRAMAAMPTKRVLWPCQTGEAYQIVIAEDEMALMLARRGIPFQTTPTGNVIILRPANHAERARSR